MYDLLTGIADSAPGPEARYESQEAISLAFITALQLLPPRQRAAVLLRDVLGFRASEAARILDVSEESVTSALKRARAALERHRSSAPPPGSPAERELVERLTAAFESADVDAIIAMMTEDAWLTMAPLPLDHSRPALERPCSGRHGRAPAGQATLSAWPRSTTWAYSVSIRRGGTLDGNRMTRPDSRSTTRTAAPRRDVSSAEASRMSHPASNSASSQPSSRGRPVTWPAIRSACSNVIVAARPSRLRGRR